MVHYSLLTHYKLAKANWYVGINCLNKHDILNGLNKHDMLHLFLHV